MKQHRHFSARETKDSEYIARLITGYTCGYLSDSQHDKLDEWVDSSDKNMFLFEDLTDANKIQQLIDWLLDADLPGALQRLKSHLKVVVN